MDEKRHERGYYVYEPGRGWEAAPPRSEYSGTHYEARWPYCRCGLYANKCSDLKAIEMPTGWPEGRPPHMISARAGSFLDTTLKYVVANHLLLCERCKAWADENDEDFTHWLWTDTE